MEQTAMQQLIDYMEKEVTFGSFIYRKKATELLAIEREQIENAFYEGEECGIEYKGPEDYFNKKYGDK